MVDKPFANLPEVLRLKVISVAAGYNDIMEAWGVLDMLENDFPSPATGLLGRLRDGFCVGSNSIRSSTESTIYWTDGSRCGG